MANTAINHTLSWNAMSRENLPRSKVVLGLITVASLGRPKSFTARSPCLRARSADSPDSRLAKPTVVVLIDGDHIGPPGFEAIFEAGQYLGMGQT